METENNVVNLQAKLAGALLDQEMQEQNQQQDDREKIVVVDFRMVTFSLSGKDYAIDIMNVKEIVKADTFTYVPNTLPFVLGVYNLRGEIIPILDLRIFFNNDVPPRADNQMENMLILTVNDQMFGVVVDRIDKVTGVQKSTIQPPHPLFGDINIKYISGVVEANKRLYVLLDIDRIFNSRISTDENARKKMQQMTRAAVQTSRTTGVSAPSAAQVSKQSAEKKSVPDAQFETNLKFVTESLANYKQFYVTSLNEQWVRRRFTEWTKTRGTSNTQLQNEKDAVEFLRPFWSRYTNAWWTKSFAEEIEKLLPDNMATNISVWNPGCGRGMETYSLACVLTKRYPRAKIKIYAQDIDLIAVSNAPLMSVPNDLAGDWFAPFVTLKTNGEYTFTQELKNSIMFEYHDCTHTNALPQCDIIFARDLLSLLAGDVQKAVTADFNEKLKSNGVLFLGENEVLLPESGFMERSVGQMTAYNK